MTNSLNITDEMYTFLDSFYNPVLAIDLKGIIIFCNKALEREARIPRESIEGKPIKEYFTLTELEEISKTGKTESAKKVIIQNRIYISNRSPLWVGKKIVGAVAVLQDISDLEFISSELQHTKKLTEELEAIIDSSFDGIFVTDGSARTIRVNEAYERITGVKRNEVIGRYMKELIMKGYYNDSVTLKVLETGKPQTLIQKIKTGKTVMVSGNPILDEKGKISIVVTNVRDVTELHNLQVELEKMQGIQKQYLAELRKLKGTTDDNEKYIIRSKKMKEVYELAMRLALVDSTVVIQGESGAGKEVIANIIHSNSKRKKEPFLKISCAAIPEHLLESELFGYAEGAFTGAKKNGKPGLFEMADKGSLLLDEIGEMPLNLQAKLLRVIQEKECTRVGSSKSFPVDVRIIAATNRDLNEMVRERKFRKDLFFRLNVVPVFVPPLRKRKDALIYFIQCFLEIFNEKYGFKKEIDPLVIEALYEYEWPGNVRELENLIERLIVVSTGDLITIENLPENLKSRSLSGRHRFNGEKKLKEMMDEFEEKIIREVIDREKSTRKAALSLGINQSTVVRKMSRYGIKG